MMYSENNWSAATATFCARFTTWASSPGARSVTTPSARRSTRSPPGPCLARPLSYVYILFLLGSRSSPSQGWSAKEFIELLTVHPSGHKQITICPYFLLTCLLHPIWPLCIVANVAGFHCQVETFYCTAGARERGRGLCGQRGGELLYRQGTSPVQSLHAIANII